MLTPIMCLHGCRDGMQIDKEGAQPERVKQELAENGLLPEEWGGETAVVAVSAVSFRHQIVTFPLVDSHAVPCCRLTLKT